MLKFGKSNAKLDELAAWFWCDVWTFSLLSGHTCPFAKECLSWVEERADGSRYVVDGEYTEFRCFSASQEAQYPNVYDSRKHNTDLLRPLKTVEEMADLIDLSLPSYEPCIIRIHVGGDFFNSLYFRAWMEVAKRHPHIIFYAYTKSLPFWIKERDNAGKLPNFVLTASFGGWKDDLIPLHKLRSAKVVFSEAQAAELSLEIDHDDTHAADPEVRDKDFALLIHGTQPKGSEASTAVKALKDKGSYRRKK